MLLSGIAWLRPLVGIFFFLFKHPSIWDYRRKCCYRAHPLKKKILRFPTRKSFILFLYLFLFILPPFYFSMFDWFLRWVSYLFIRSLLCTLCFTELRRIFRYIPACKQVFAWGWAYNCVQKTRSTHRKTPVNHTRQCVMKPIAGPH